MFTINPFLGNIPIFLSSENIKKRRLSGVTKGYKMGIIAGNELEFVDPLIITA